MIEGSGSTLLTEVKPGPGFLTTTLMCRVLEGGTGSTLLVFSPRAPALRTDKIYSMIRQVICCNYDEKLAEMTSFYIAKESSLVTSSQLTYSLYPIVLGYYTKDDTKEHFSGA